MNSFIASKVREIALELILDALENGSAIDTAYGLRAEIIAGFNKALEDSGMPEECQKEVKL
jgi:hypothetical protein